MRDNEGQDLLVETTDKDYWSSNERQKFKDKGEKSEFYLLFISDFLCYIYSVNLA